MNTNLIQTLKPVKEKVRVVIDTDTFNEIDDQFALVYALKSQEKMDVEAIYAAPFYGSHKVEKASNPQEGMERSYQEIIKLLQIMNINTKNFVYKGSTNYLDSLDKPQKSEAVSHLINKAMSASKDDPLYVIAIGAITNIASAILIEPKIIENIVVVWLGGHAHYWPETKEFNLRQDIIASRFLFDCQVPLVQIPCKGVASHLLTSLPELKEYAKGKSEIGDYLYQIFSDYRTDHYAFAKPLWDISAIAYMINPDWVPTNIVHRPIVTDQITWSFDTSRHPMRVATWVDRDSIYKDFFMKLEK